LLVGSTNQPTNRSNLFEKNLIMAASACHGSREAIIYCNRLLCLFIYSFIIYFLIFQSWISETAGDSSAELSRQVVWGLE